MALRRYQEVLRRPHVLRLLITAMLARLPQGMAGLAILLLLTPEVGYARAGLATGMSVVTAGVSNILLARAVDRVGARPVLAPAAVLYAAAMLTLAAETDAGYGVQLLICAVIGLVTPPISSVSRGLWPRLVGDDAAQVIYGLEATAQELVYVSGPAAVALIAGLASARAAVVVSGLIGLIGALAYVSAPPFADAHRAVVRASRQSVLFGTGVLRYALVGGFATLAFSMAEIATVDFVGGRSASAASGVVLALWSFGSLIGGLWFGASRSVVTDGNLAVGVALTATGITVAALAPDTVGLGVILLCAGLAIAPTMARLYTRMGSVAGEGSTTEAFGWLAVGFLFGSAIGSILGGLSVDAFGARVTFVLAGLGAASGVPVILARRPVASTRGRRQAPHPDVA